MPDAIAPVSVRPFVDRGPSQRTSGRDLFRWLPIVALALGCNAYVQGGDGGTDAAGNSGLPAGGLKPPGGPGASGGSGGPGTIDKPDLGMLPPPTMACDQSAAPAAPLRRLTRWEYDNTVLDLLGDTSRPGTRFIPEAEQFGFDNSAAGAVLSPVVVEQFESAADALATRAVSNLGALLGCDPKSQGEDPCAKQFIGAFFKRAYRRELGANERTRLEAFYQKSKTDGGFATAISRLVSAALQSPKFLYRLEFGMPAPGTAAAVPLSAWELASRLSYLLVGSMPDADLIRAAEQNQLSTAEQVLGHARRLLDSERGARVVRNFYRQWASLDRLDNLQREGTGFTAATPALLAEETETFVDQVIRQGDGTLATLLTAPYSYMNRDLAGYYGVKGPSSTAFVRVDLDATRYSGLLTQGALMAELAHEKVPSPVARGRFIREQVLCTPMPDPPADLNAVLPTPDPKATARKQLEQLTSGNPCNTCHPLINPIGFAFEHFDHLGRYRQTDGSLPVDSAGQLTGTDVDGPYADHMGLAKLLAKSEKTRSCVVETWFRYAHGRTQTAEDACSAQQLGQAFSQGGGNIKQLILSLTQTRAFMYRDATKAGTPL